jgi:hypothetical protein
VGSGTAREAEKGKRLTRKQSKGLGRRIWSNHPGLDVVHGDAAGIDIGSRELYLAVGPDRDPHPVQAFGCFTVELQRLAKWLRACGVKTPWRCSPRECTGYRYTACWSGPVSTYGR